jgi:predicted Rossmann fold flavoprotein
VIVIGGGAAGMYAASAAARSGARVLLLEKNEELGRKLAITGGGRCNITNNRPISRDMLAQYGEAGKFLFSAFAQHGVTDTIQWFAERGLAVKEGNDGRLFPVTERASDVVAALTQALQDAGVQVVTGSVIKTIERVKSSGGSHESLADELFAIITSRAQYHVTRVIIATGGYSRPETGSTGDGFGWARTLGHTINDSDMALVPLTLHTEWTRALSGLGLPDVGLRVLADGSTVAKGRGRMLFTHLGVSGPLILNHSKLVGDALQYNEVTLLLNVLPDLDAGACKEWLHELLQTNKTLQNALAQALPAQLVRGLLAELEVAGDTPSHSVLSEDRKRVRLYLQAIPLRVKGLMGPDKAVVSSGGVRLEEIDFRTMESRLVPGLYLVGDMLDINRPSGGYSLQLCWTTGYVAGLAAAASRPVNAASVG